jgi:two-component system OmpR family response regulator
MTTTDTRPRVLVVDDEPKIAQIVAAYLERDGFQVLRATDGRVALNTVRADQPDLLILDLMLPEVTGWDVCRELRRNAQTAHLPIIMLTARDDVADRIVGLELGADDYVVKPFDPKELVARVRAVLRRVGDQAGKTNGASTAARTFQRGELWIDPNGFEARLAGQPLVLTRTEFQILAALAGEPGRVFSRLQLLDLVQGEEYEGYERTIDSHVKNLRRKIESDPRHPQLIQTVFGVGYKFVPQAQHDPTASA